MTRRHRRCVAGQWTRHPLASQQRDGDPDQVCYGQPIEVNGSIAVQS